MGAQSTNIKPNSENSPDSSFVAPDSDQLYVQGALQEGDLFSFARQIAIGMVRLCTPLSITAHIHA